MEPQPQNGTTPQQPHTPIVRTAAKALIDKHIPVVEYGQQIQWRNGNHLVLSIVEWAVPDELLSFASQILSNLGLSRASPSTGAADRYGYWERACLIHKLNDDSVLYVYPLSSLGLSLQDTVEVTSTFDPMLQILTPKPPMYMGSLIRHLLNHPVGDSSRLRAQDDLLSFISFYILRDKVLDTKGGECEDEESEEDFQKRVEDALSKMKTWDWGRNGDSYLVIAQSLVRDCRSIGQLSNC